MTINRDGQVPDSYQGINPITQPKTVLANRAPTASDRRYKLGTTWIDRPNNQAYLLTNVSAGVANWAQGSSGGTATVMSTLYTAPAATDLDITVPTGQDGVVKLGDAAGSNKLSVTDSADAEVLAVDSNGAVTASGAVSSAGNVVMSAVATQLVMNGGAATDFIGQATLASGTATVLNTNIKSGDRIFLTRADLNSASALGELTVTAQTASTSFVITAIDASDGSSTITGDTSIVNYFIVSQT